MGFHAYVGAVQILAIAFRRDPWLSFSCTVGSSSSNRVNIVPIGYQEQKRVLQSFEMVSRDTCTVLKRIAPQSKWPQVNIRDPKYGVDKY